MRENTSRYFIKQKQRETMAITAERKDNNNNVQCEQSALLSRADFGHLVLFVLSRWNLSVILAVSLCTRVKVMQAGRLSAGFGKSLRKNE